MTADPSAPQSLAHDSHGSIVSGILLVDNYHYNSTDYDDYDGGEFEGDGRTPLSFTFSIIRLCLAVFGVLANSVTAVVLANRKIWSPTSLLLLTLVAYDALFLLASIPLCVIDTFITVDMETFAIVFGVIYPLRYMAQTGSIYTTVTLTIERFMIVLRPLKARVFCTFGKMKRLTIAVFIFAVIFNIPRCFFYLLLTSFAPVPLNYGNSTTNVTSGWPKTSPNVMPRPVGEINGTITYVMVQIEAEERRKYYTWLYMRVYELYVSGVFFYLLPYALIPILNMQLLLAIKKRRDETRRISVKNEHQMNNVKPTDKEDGLTMIVLGITVCFFICCLVPAVYNVTQIAKMPSTTGVSAYLLIASDTMLCVNASTDFFFYCLLGRRFRTIFLQIFCRRPLLGRSYMANGHSRYNDTCYHSV